MHVRTFPVWHCNYYSTAGLLHILILVLVIFVLNSKLAYFGAKFFTVPEKNLGWGPSNFGVIQIQTYDYEIVLLRSDWCCFHAHLCT